MPSPRHKKSSLADGLNNAEVHVLLEDRLRAEGRDDLAEVLVKCRVPFRLKCLCCNAEITVDQGCKKRWCPTCSPKIVAKRYARVGPTAARMKWPLSVMLSKKNPLEIMQCIHDMKKAFRGFRRTAFWRDSVKGGYVGFEVTFNDRTPHVHLHALVDCRWLAIATPEPTRRHTQDEKKRLCELAQLELRAAWAGYLGQSDAYVYVQRADKKALAETLKYPIKPRDLLDLKCRVSDLIDEMDQGRLVAAFGNCSRNSKCWLGRDEVPPVVKLCNTCKGDKTIFPATSVQLWNCGAVAPPASALRAMDLLYQPGGPPLDIAGKMQLPDGQWVTHDEWDKIMTAAYG